MGSSPALGEKTVGKGIDYKALLLVYRALHNQAPEYTRDMLHGEN